MTTLEQQPSIGRIVHYIASGGAHWAAIITEVQDRWEGEDNPRIGLTAFHPGGHTTRLGVQQDDSASIDGTWHWPERV